MSSPSMLNPLTERRELEEREGSYQELLLVGTKKGRRTRLKPPSGQNTALVSLWNPTTFDALILLGKRT